MAKKKKITDDEVLDIEEEEMTSVPEDPVDEDEDRDETDNEDSLAEDEDDKQIIAKLEKADREEAEKIFLFEEEIGYNSNYDWTDRSIFPEKEEDDAKRVLIEMTTDEVNNYKLKSTASLFNKWTLALACKKRGLNDKFVELARDILKGVKNDERLCFADIYLELVDTLMRQNQNDEALEVIAKYKDDADKFMASFTTAEDNKKSKKAKTEEAKKDIRVVEFDEHAVEIVRGILLAKTNQLSEAKSVFDHLVNRPFYMGIPEAESSSKAGADAERRLVMFEIAQALASVGVHDLAFEYFDKSKKLADLEDDKKLILEIENAIDRTEKSRVL